MSSKEFSQAISNLKNDPYRLADVMLRPSKLLKRPFSFSTKQRRESNSKRFQDAEGTDWSLLLNAWLDACQAASEGQVLQCCTLQLALHAEFNQKFQASKGNLLVPTLHSVCKCSHRLAALVHTLGGDSEKLNQAASLLQDSYSKTSNDRKPFNPDAPYDTEGSKKVGTLGVVNQLFAIYFVLNTLRLCTNLIRPVEARNLHTQGSSSEMVTYRYYAGRLSLFEDNFETAQENLEYAFHNCHKDAIGNKRRILRYLIPVKIFRGQLPTRQLLERYNLTEFMEICAAIQKGDLRQFNAAMTAHEDRFIRQGSYLLLERCKTLCYRNLLKRIQLAIGSHQVPTEDLIRACHWLGDPLDFDEAECLAATMMSSGIVRGYIHHKLRTIVLSKRDPFPKTAFMT